MGVQLQRGLQFVGLLLATDGLSVVKNLSLICPNIEKTSILSGSQANNSP